MAKRKICIDAGHGGTDSGALGPNGLKEAHVALAVAMLLGSMLVNDFEVVYTRRTDDFVPLDRRAIIANDSQSDAFISIHCNAGETGSGDGFEVWTTRGETPADAFATDLFSAYAAVFTDKRARMDMGDGDPDKEADFSVLRKTRMPAVLFELEFIHTYRGETWLKDHGNQLLCARALAAGVRKHYGITPVPTLPSLPEPAEPPLLPPSAKERLIEIAAELVTMSNEA